MGYGRAKVDVAVFAADFLLAGTDFVMPPTQAMVFGQETYFAGFPMAMHFDFGQLQRPIAFVKKGVISGATARADGDVVIYVDAINNEGFSGGPLLARANEQAPWSVIGVVSGFKTSHERVMNQGGEPTGAYVEYNTGFLIAYGIVHALEMIDRNPIGFVTTRV